MPIGVKAGTPATLTGQRCTVTVQRFEPKAKHRRVIYPQIHRTTQMAGGCLKQVDAL
jgi:hypothetical protein